MIVRKTNYKVLTKVIGDKNHYRCAHCVDDDMYSNKSSFQSKIGNNVLYEFEPLSCMHCGSENNRASLCDLNTHR